MFQSPGFSNLDFNVPYPADSQIEIPPELPTILKEYTKSVLRAQPEDLLQWSAQYFRRLADTAKPKPVSDVSIFGPKHGGLSLAIVQLMYEEFKKKDHVSLTDLKAFWDNQRLAPNLLQQFLKTACIDIPLDDVEWLKILALATAGVSMDLKETLKHICVVCGLGFDEPKAHFQVFRKVYAFLATVTGEDPSKTADMISHFQGLSERQDGYVGYSDIEGVYF